MNYKSIYTKKNYGSILTIKKIYFYFRVIDKSARYLNIKIISNLDKLCA